MRAALAVKDGRRYRAATRDEVLEAAARYFVAETQGKALRAPGDAVEFARSLVAGRDSESFGLIYLDTRHRVIDAVPRHG